ncbi:MAG: transcriptional repressor LexA [Candidatus Kerfeldbacteria bacterium]|nr:transcriptional repressor LexA [Candidatus Kerfeldbacteria bacterium]
MTTILPKKKQELLSFIKDYINRNGYAPTLTEIAKTFKVRSLATVHEHLEFLERNGFIRRSSNGRRELTVLAPDAEAVYDEAASFSLPLVGLITAGKPIEAIEDREAMMSVPQEIVGKKNAYILRVRGDSMIESLIADGDLIIVEKTDYARDGDMVVALLDDGTATLKKFYRQKNLIRLQPANKNYKPLLVKSVIIQGRVLGVIRKVS